jgi:hypothetical protein
MNPDPHGSEKVDPEFHGGEKLIRIRMEVKSWIRSFIEKVKSESGSAWKPTQVEVIQSDCGREVDPENNESFTEDQAFSPSK